MQRIGRVKLFIIATIACAVLFCIAAFSVSFASWNVGGGSSATKVVKGNAANFYVEYPQYVAGDTVIPQLQSETYYLQVPQRGNIGMSDYYEMGNNPGNSSEKMIQSVYLYKNDVVDLFYGKSPIHIANNKNTSNTTDITFSSNKYTVKTEGFFDFYYEFADSSKTMFVKYIGKPSEGESGNTGDTGNTGETTTVTPERDQTKESVKIKFSDATVVFQMENSLSGGPTYFYIWKADVAGQKTEWPGLEMSTGADVACTAATANQGNSVELGFSYKDVAGIILNNNTYQTGEGTDFYTAVFSGELSANYTYKITTTKTHWNDFTNGINMGKDELKNYFSVEGTPAGSGSGGSTVCDTEGYSSPFTVKFSDDDTPKTLYFRVNPSATGDFSKIDKASIYIWVENGDNYYSDGGPKLISANEGNILSVGAKSNTQVIFAFNTGNTGWNYQTDNLWLKDYAVDEVNCITLHTSKKGANPTLDKSGLAAGGGSGEADDRTPADPDYEGSTSFDADAEQKLYGAKTVRELKAGVQKVDNKYVYKNYICISRKNSETTTADNSIAYIEFKIDKDKTCNVDPYDIIITKLTLKRRATDAHGNIQNDFMNPAPRIYNFDSSADTRLGPAATHTAPDPDDDEGRYPIFSHGNQHLVEGVETIEGETKYEHMINHYDDGAYVVLYFADNEQQYFALDLEIEFTLADGVEEPDEGVQFTLLAQANNKNSWERYEDGYGEPWGFYMGGKINGIDVWDPSRTAKLERASTDYVTDFNADSEQAALNDQSIGASSVESATTAQINAFNALSDFNYKLIKFFKEGGELEGYARYPKGKIDVSLTVNLTEKSLIKMYMLDNTGQRKSADSRTVWVMPNEIVYDKVTRDLFLDPIYNIYDKDLNIIIPKTGTYIFRLVGYFHTRDEGVVDSNGITKTGSWFKFSDGKRYDSLNGNEGKQLPNFNLIVDTLYITCASEGNSTFTLTLNANGGAFKAADVKPGETSSQITRKITFGTDITKLPKPTKTGMTFLGWTYVDNNGEVQNLGSGHIVTENMTLTARWGAKRTITFNPNGGTLPSEAGTTAETASDSKLTAAQLNKFTPTYSDADYAFDGWWTAANGGDKITTDYVFADSITVYAHWKKVVFTVTFNGNNGTPSVASQKTNSNGDGKLASLPGAMRDGYEFNGWWTMSGDNEGTRITTATVFERDATVYAHWLENVVTYTITFNGNGGTPSKTSMDTQGDGKLEELPTASRDEYTLDGWWTAANGGTQITTDYVFEEDATVYAHWKKVVFTVTFDGNGGTPSTQSQKTNSNGDGKLASLPGATRTGYNLDGWYTEAEGGNKIAAGTNGTVFEDDATVYAHWNAIPYKVTFDVNTANKGSGTNTVYENRTYGTTVAKPSDPNSSDPLYDFDGWYDQATGGTKLTLSANVTVSGTKTYYAQYKAARYRIELNVSNWPGANHSTAYTYHIHAWGTSIVTGADAPNGADKFDYRDELTSMGSNKYYIELTKEVEHVVITQDQNGTRNEISRYRVDASLKLGNTYTYTPTISNVTIDGTRQIGLQFNDGIVVLNASYDTGWTDSNQPNQIYMWKSSGSTITAGWSGGQAGDNITYGKFKKYNCNLGDVYGIILAQDGTGWTGDIKPGDANTSHAALVNGNIYNIKYNALFEKYGTLTRADNKAAANSNIGSSGVWLVGEGLDGGGWSNGIQLKGNSGVVYVKNASQWLKIRYDNGGEFNAAQGDNVSVKNGNFYLSKAGYYLFIWVDNQLKVTFIRE